MTLVKPSGAFQVRTKDISQCISGPEHDPFRHSQGLALLRHDWLITIIHSSSSLILGSQPAPRPACSCSLLLMIDSPSATRRHR